MGVNDWLWQQQRLIDMIDSPALRAIQEVQERGSWLQTQESIAEALSRSELQDSLVDTVPSLMFSEIKDTLTDSPLHFSLAEQSAIDNALQATRPLQTLSEAMEQILEGTKRLGVSDLSEIGAESGIAAKQTFEDISLSTTVDQFLRATQTSVHAELEARNAEISALSHLAFQSPEWSETDRTLRDIQSSLTVPEGMSQILGSLENELRSGEASWATSVAEATRGLVDNYESLRNLQPDRAIDELLRQTDWLREMQRAHFPPVTAFSHQLFDVLQMQNSLAVLDTTFVGELLSWLHDAEATRSEPEREEFLKDLFEWLAEKFQQLPQGRISLEGAIGIFLSVSTFLYSTWSSGQMEKRLTEKFMAAVSEKKIPSKIEELGPNLTYRKRYVVAVTDRLRLRKDPSLEAPILAFLLPNTLVEEIDQRENWSLVEFFDYTEGGVKKGWTCREHLQAIQPRKG